MRISKRFKLNASQAELDFVDIDTNTDTPLFLDPQFLGARSDAWSVSATRTLQSFFSYFLALLQGGNEDDARNLFDHLHEPNETCLGLSTRQPQGRGVGRSDAEKIFQSIVGSKAAQTGLLEDLQDCRIFVKGVDKDKISDMTTNIIRGPLIQYTQQQCSLWGIPLQSNSSSGFCWNAGTRAWENGFTDNLYVNHRRILLIPKAVVSYAADYTPQKYHRHFVLNYLQNENLRMRTALVQQRIRKGKVISEFVTKKSIIENGQAPEGDKDFLASFAKKHPSVFKDFKARTEGDSLPIEDLVKTDLADIAAHLKQRLATIPSGKDSATDYHRTTVGILDFLFYPELINPVIEKEIHEGRKRIDLTFDNAARSGFFRQLHEISYIPCTYILVECKNYSRDLANPELDQMGGRFSPNRGQFGLVVCRNIEDHERIMAGCRDTFRDQRGLILPLTDADLQEALTKRADGVRNPLEDRLVELKRSVALS